MSQREPVIDLEHSEPFAVGGRRVCYVHPDDLNKCIKVLRQDELKTVRIDRGRIVPARFRRQYDNNAHEMRVLALLARQMNSEADRFLPRCYGMFDTTRGPGLVLDLVRDHDGGIARTLRELISTGHDPAEFRTAFDVLAEQMLRNMVMTRALLDHNVVAQDGGDGTWRLFIIDGLGDRAWLPLSRLIPPLARARIRRRLAEAWPRFEKLVENPITPEIVQRSNWSQGFLQHRG